MFDSILVAIGANLASAVGPTPLATCEWAVQRLAALPGLELRRQSRWYATRPVPSSDQPDYVNGVALLRGSADPHALLRSLLAIEAAAGRVRGAPNAARTLDLDLLAINGLIVSTDTLTLPHPRLQERAFVLAPLADVSPNWRHPLLNVTVASLLPGVADQEIVAL